jgi:hypothetical protein
MVIGGMFKTLKTSIALDLLLCIGTATDFLGQFRTVRTARAVYFLGEGRGRFAQGVCQRIAEQKGLDLAHVENVYLCRELPNLDNGGDLQEVKRVLQRRRAEFAFFDPLYLGLAESGERAGNVFVIGQRLAAVQQTCQAAGATAVINHHLRKGRVETDPATLSDLAQAGAAEFAGQWLLLNRTRPYDEANPGVHELRLSIGSRLTDSSLWKLHMEEHAARASPGRVWHPEVTPRVEAVQADRTARQQAGEATQRETIERHKDQILQAVAMFGPQGETQAIIRAAVGLSGSRFGAALGELIRERTILPCEVQKPNRKTPYQGYRLAE